MSNFSNIIAQSRNNSDKARFDALSRSAAMRAKRLELEQEEKDRLAKQYMFAQELGFKQDQLRSTDRRESSKERRAQRESAAERQNRLDVAKLNVGGRLVTNENTVAGREKVAGINVAGRKEVAGINADSKDYATDVNYAGKVYTADSSNDAQKYTADRGVDKANISAEARGKSDEAANLRAAAKTRAMQAAQEADRELKMSIADLQSKDRNKALQARIRHNHATIKMQKARVLADLSDNIGSDKVAESKVHEVLAELQNDEQSFNDELEGARGDVGDEGEPLDVKPSNVSPSGVEGPVGPKGTEAPKPTVLDKFKGKAVTSLAGLKGKDRTDAQAAYKKQVADRKQVYERALAKGASQKQAKELADEWAEQSLGDATAGDNAAIEAAQQAKVPSWHMLTPTKKDGSYKSMLDKGAGKYVDDNGSSMGRNILERIAGARIPERVPLLGGSDLLPGSTDSVASNVTQAGLMMAGAAGAEKLAPYAGKYLGPIANKIGEKVWSGMGYVPGAQTTAKVLNYVPSKISGAMDSAIEGLPGMANKAGRAFGEAEARAAGATSKFAPGWSPNGSGVVDDLAATQMMPAVPQASKPVGFSPEDIQAEKFSRAMDPGATQIAPSTAARGLQTQKMPAVPPQETPLLPPYEEALNDQLSKRTYIPDAAAFEDLVNGTAAPSVTKPLVSQGLSTQVYGASDAGMQVPKLPTDTQPLLAAMKGGMQGKPHMVDPHVLMGTGGPQMKLPPQKMSDAFAVGRIAPGEKNNLGTAAGDMPDGFFDWYINNTPKRGTPGAANFDLTDPTKAKQLFEVFKRAPNANAPVSTTAVTTPGYKATPEVAQMMAENAGVDANAFVRWANQNGVDMADPGAIGGALAEFMGQ
jgi:hypothetical protein